MGIAVFFFGRFIYLFCTQVSWTSKICEAQPLYKPRYLINFFPNQVTFRLVSPVRNSNTLGAEKSICLSVFEQGSYPKPWNTKPMKKMTNRW